MNAKELGIFSGCLELGIPAEDFEGYSGFHSVWDANQTKEAGVVVTAFKDILEKLDLTATEVYPYVKSAALKHENDAWDYRCQAVADGIYDTMERIEHVKQASTLTDLAGIGMKGVLALSAATGIGAGALYWTLKRDANAEAAPNEKLRGQIDYYRNLSKDVEGSIKRRMDASAGQQASAL